MRSNMHIVADQGTTFKIANNISSDGAPVRMSMFFSNEFLHDISIDGLTLDMNGANNPISPSRGSGTYSRFTQAGLIFSGTPGGVAAGANDVRINRCSFINTAGVSCIVMSQSNSTNVVLGTRWNVTNNRFYNNGFDTDDHSSVYAVATDIMVTGNSFINPDPWGTTGSTGGWAAFEIHGSNTSFTKNIIKNYRQGLWISTNVVESIVSNIEVAENIASVSYAFCDFWSANLGNTDEVPISNVSILNNVLTITDDTEPASIKVFIKIGATKQPSNVLVSGNICTSLETTQDTVLAMALVTPGQILEGSGITIHNNVAAGITCGLVVYFDDPAEANFGGLTFTDNDTGDMSSVPSAIYPHSDVYLYGSNAGKVNMLRLSGLRQATPIVTSGSSRARVYGTAVVPIVPVWNGITVGNGVSTSKITLDSDNGCAHLHLRFYAGSTSTASGNIYVSLPGLTADINSALPALIQYPAGNDYNLTGRVDFSATYVSINAPAGDITDTNPAVFAEGTAIYIGGAFPCSYADI
jgi:hypothetical protein